MRYLLIAIWLTGAVLAVIKATEQNVAVARTTITFTAVVSTSTVIPGETRSK